MCRAPVCWSKYTTNGVITTRLWSLIMPSLGLNNSWTSSLKNQTKPYQISTLYYFNFYAIKRLTNKFWVGIFLTVRWISKLIAFLGKPECFWVMQYLFFVGNAISLLKCLFNLILPLSLIWPIWQGIIINGSVNQTWANHGSNSFQCIKMNIFFSFKQSKGIKRTVLIAIYLKTLVEI